MPPDTTETVEIGQSPARMGGLLLAGIALMSISVACGLFAMSHPGSFLGTGVGYLGLLFFGFCTLRNFWLLVTRRGRPVIVLSQEGIRDIRLAKEIIPWTAIHDVSSYQMYRERVMVLSVDPVLESRLTLTDLARRTRSLNRRLGADGLCVTTTGLAVGFDRLFAAVWIYHDAHA